MPATAPTLTSLVNAYGAYFIEQGASVANLLSNGYYDKVMSRVLMQVSTQNTRWRDAIFSQSSVLQAWQRQFTVKGATTVVANEIELQRVKMDVSIQPDDYMDSYLGFMTANSLDPRTYPILAYIIEQHIIPKFNEEYELDAIWAGEYAAPTPGTPGAAGASMNGLKFVINY
jgi:hypothetical protein